MATTAGNEHSAYPFTGIVGMADLKLALLLNAVSPAIGGVLVRGEKGTAKSTMVRGLAALLPPVPVVPGCPYSCDPAAPDPACPAGPHGAATPELRPVTLAELPVGATEDRLTGSLDIERVLTAGTTAFQPGLLAAAHRGVLYVDEVNLLDDHIVDVLLDAAAMGINVVEREGLSIAHPSRFILVGTMNPDEGELRPQLLDRFGLCVDVVGMTDVDQRVEIAELRASWDRDPLSVAEKYEPQEQALRCRIQDAMTRCADVVVPRSVRRIIAHLSVVLKVDGHRADVVLARAAQTMAAYEEAAEVDPHHLTLVADMVYRHRQPDHGAPDQNIGAVLNRVVAAEARTGGARPAGMPSQRPIDI